VRRRANFCVFHKKAQEETPGICKGSKGRREYGGFFFKSESGTHAA
jgi:hypothetical protein